MGSICSSGSCPVLIMGLILDVLISFDFAFIGKQWIFRRRCNGDCIGVIIAVTAKGISNRVFSVILFSSTVRLWYHYGIEFLFNFLLNHHHFSLCFSTTFGIWFVGVGIYSIRTYNLSIVGLSISSLRSLIINIVHIALVQRILCILGTLGSCRRIRVIGISCKLSGCAEGKESLKMSDALASHQWH